MKRRILSVTFLLGVITGYSQTSIGTKLPDKSAMLEVSSDRKGVLIPRLLLKSVSDQSTVAGYPYPEGLLVYHSGNSFLSAGFYYWENKRWNILVTNENIKDYITEVVPSEGLQIVKVGDDYVFKWKDQFNAAQEFSISDVVKALEQVTSLTSTNKEGGVALIYKDEEAQNTTIDLAPLLTGSSEFQNYIKSFIQQEAIKETTTDIVSTYDAKYKFYNENRLSLNYTPLEIDVIKDLENNFSSFLNNENVKRGFEELALSAEDKKLTFENGKFWVTTLTDKKLEKKEVDYKELFDFKETATSIRSLKDEQGKDTIGFEYIEENNLSYKIHVLGDIVNRSEEIFDNEYTREIVKNARKNNAPITVEVVNGSDIKFTWKDSNNQIKTFLLSNIVDNEPTLTKLESTGIGWDTSNYYNLKYLDEKKNTNFIYFSDEIIEAKDYSTYLQGVGKDPLLVVQYEKFLKMIPNSSYFYYRDPTKPYVPYKFKNWSLDSMNDNTIMDVLNDFTNNSEVVFDDAKVQSLLSDFFSKLTVLPENLVLFKDDSFKYYVIEDNKDVFLPVNMNMLGQNQTFFRKEETNNYPVDYVYVNEKKKEYPLRSRDAVKSSIDRILSVPKVLTAIESGVDGIERRPKFFVENGEIGYEWITMDEYSEDISFITKRRLLKEVYQMYRKVKMLSAHQGILYLESESLAYNQGELAKKLTENETLREQIQGYIDQAKAKLKTTNVDQHRESTKLVNQSLDEYLLDGESYVGEINNQQRFRYMERVVKQSDTDDLVLANWKDGLPLEVKIINEDSNLIYNKIELVSSSGDKAKFFLKNAKDSDNTIPKGNYYVIIDYLKKQ
ncbi:hypothetical protein [Myroides odoratimimus]|uniref:hypothetical protein n=1 Tax=Myroides odoratimimus TaxID=76832 RepID=UPI0031018C6D